jgi:SAM-dependent methyltransferase
MTRASGTEGYAEEAEALLVQYEGLAFEHVQRWTLPLIPPGPRRILEIGAGTGRDAAGFAALGHSVVAVEPTAEFRMRAAELHRGRRGSMSCSTPTPPEGTQKRPGVGWTRLAFARPPAETV